MNESYTSSAGMQTASSEFAVSATATEASNTDSTVSAPMSSSSSAPAAAALPGTDNAQVAPTEPMDEDMNATANPSVAASEEHPATLIRNTKMNKVDRDGEVVGERYHLHTKIGRWPWGPVYRAEDVGLRNSTAAGAAAQEAGFAKHKTVAIKCVQAASDFNGVPRVLLREVSLLRSLNSTYWNSSAFRSRECGKQEEEEDNSNEIKGASPQQRQQKRRQGQGQGQGHGGIIALLDVVVEEGAAYLVYEFLPLNLRDYLATLVTPLKPTVVRDFALQLCLALEYCHQHGVIHRNVRPDSIRMSPNNQKLILSDFKFAKAICPPTNNMTPEAGGEGTLWYRAPEVLMGSTTYSTPVDVWALGATIAEIASKRPMFPGNTDVDQLIKVFQCRGTPREANWEGVSSLPHYLPVCPEWQPLCLSRYLPEPVLGSTGLAMLEGMLTMNPSRRLLLADARRHPYLQGKEEELMGHLEPVALLTISTPVPATISSDAVANWASTGADTGAGTGNCAGDDNNEDAKTKGAPRKRRKKESAV